MQANLAAKRHYSLHLLATHVGSYNHLQLSPDGQQMAAVSCGAPSGSAFKDNDVVLLSTEPTSSDLINAQPLLPSLPMSHPEVLLRWSVDGSKLRVLQISREQSFNEHCADVALRQLDIKNAVVSNIDSSLTWPMEAQYHEDVNKAWSCHGGYCAYMRPSTSAGSDAGSAGQALCISRLSNAATIRVDARRCSPSFIWHPFEDGQLLLLVTFPRDKQKQAAFLVLNVGTCAVGPTILTQAKGHVKLSAWDPVMQYAVVHVKGAYMGSNVEWGQLQVFCLRTGARKLHVDLDFLDDHKALFSGAGHLALLGVNEMPPLWVYALPGFRRVFMCDYSDDGSLTGSLMGVSGLCDAA